MDIVNFVKLVLQNFGALIFSQGSTLLAIGMIFMIVVAGVALGNTKYVTLILWTFSILLFSLTIYNKEILDQESVQIYLGSAGGGAIIATISTITFIAKASITVIRKITKAFPLKNIKLPAIIKKNLSF